VRELVLPAMERHGPISAWIIDDTSFAKKGEHSVGVTRAAHRDERLSQPRDEEWLLIEWAQGEAEPSKYWLSTMPQDMPFADLVDLAKLRWRDPSATITSSSRRSGSAITRAAAGAASTTTPHCASRPTAS
jgi:SRSO17 transposase